MKRFLAFALLALLPCCNSASQPTTVVIAPTAAASQSTTPGTLLVDTSASADDDACARDNDCTWGEIPIEITRKVDCMCLLGCPGLPQNTAVNARREAQHAKLCSPHMDGHGNGCPIDDCARPPPIKCISGHCKAAARQ